MVVWAMGALLYEELWACGYFFLLLPDDLKASYARALKA